MAPIILNGILVVVLTMINASDVQKDSNLGYSSVRYSEGENKAQCRYSKVYSMLKVQCSYVDLMNFPRELNSSVQVLDASFNKIRIIRSNSLSPYKTLVHINISNNLIANIEESSFARQHYLEVLDLTNNAIQYLPNNLFQLSNLRELYLAINQLDESALKIDAVSSPLILLQLRRNNLTRLPEMGYLPSLRDLIISENKIRKITTEQLARFCHLRSLDASKNPLRLDENACKCVALTDWLESRGTEFKPPLNCTKTAIRRCANVTSFGNDKLLFYEGCTNVISVQTKAKERHVRIIVASCISSLILLILCVLYCLKKQEQRYRRRMQQQIATNINVYAYPSTYIQHDWK